MIIVQKPEVVLDQVDVLEKQAQQQLSALDTLPAVAEFQTLFLGKKSPLSALLKQIPLLELEDRARVGKAVQLLKERLVAEIEAKKSDLQQRDILERLEQERWDISTPAPREPVGSVHIITQIRYRLSDVMESMGFVPLWGPEVETDYYNFQAANIPKHHPARDMQDTFFVSPGVVLRTHTTSVQMRALAEKKHPIRMFCHGAVFRSDSDATHTPMFHQMEALCLGQNIHLGHLKGVLEQFLKALFGSTVRMRLRTSYFPFVEPGVEVDLSCFACRKGDCNICKGTGWIEILGAGMLHPAVLAQAGFAADHGLSGFALGLGLERLAMLLTKVPDIRYLFSSEPRLHQQFHLQ